MKQFLVLIFIFTLPVFLFSQKDFITKPYLQVGYNANVNSLEVLWHTEDSLALWDVYYFNSNATTKIKSDSILFNNINLEGVSKFKVFHAILNHLESGTNFKYQIFKNNKMVFESIGKAPKAFSQEFSFVCFGDIGAETVNQNKLARIAYNLNPDLIAVPGDIVYEDGLVKEYAKKFWPIYNADEKDTIGVPLMRSTPFIAAVGNHDVDNIDFNKNPDALAYYYFWAQPLNGPIINDSSIAYPSLKGTAARKNGFLKAAGKAYPAMNNFSYDYGNAHWTVIDADTYVDWTNQELTNWVKLDLKKSEKSTWHFVMFHHPGFNSSREHFEQQQMRLLSPIFEEGNVDIVFNGHVHNFQRTFPLKFIPDRKGTLLVGGKENKTLRGRVVNGKWTLDKTFDGIVNKKPKGVIYIITGAGGKELYNPEQTNDIDSWQKFTSKFYALEHSLSYITIKDKSFKFQQISVNGKLIDEFEVLK